MIHAITLTRQCIKPVVLFVALFILLGQAIHAQTTHYVKPVAAGTGDGSSWANASPDLQTIIDNSVNGDQVWVAAGAYQRGSGQFFSMKEGVKIYGGFAGTETLLSQRNWTINTTILQGNGNSVIQNLSIGLTSAAVLDGFTVTGGNASDGGGMYNSACSPTISNCIFSGNSAATGGGMRNTSSSSPTITNCVFSGNTASAIGGGGAGMANESSSPILTNCTFSNNSTAQSGGAVVNAFSSAIFNNCLFSGNQSARGGAAYNSNSSLTFNACTFENNSSVNVILGSGGAVYNSNTNTIIDQCAFTGNSCYVDGGAIFFTQSGGSLTRSSFIGNMANNTLSKGGAIRNIESSPVISHCTFSGNSAQIAPVMANSSGSNSSVQNCLFSGNKALNQVGAIYNISSSPGFINCTFAGNNSPFGGTINNISNSAPAFTNCIIWANSGAIEAEPGSVATVQYSIVQGGYAGTGNLNADPGFFNVPDFNAAPYTSGDFRISSCSPAYNTGSNVLLPGTLTADLAGRPRVLGIAVDMGVYEAGLMPGAGNILYVNSSLPLGSGNGYADTWSNATWYLSTALQYAKQNESLWTPANPLKIFVARGVQMPLGRPDLLCNMSFNDRNNTFLLVNNVQIYGGFDPANGIDDLSDARIFDAGGTILSGDIGLPGNNSDNSYHVITSSGTVNNVIVDGFTITGGNANGAGSIVVNGNSIPNNNGGGIYHYASAPVYANCIISGNNASNWGGGIYAALAPAFSMSNSTITANTASAGAGIFNNGSSPAITACSITNNNATFGAAIYNSGGAPTVVNTGFSGNQSQSYGGAVYNSGAAASYTNCTFSNNSTVSGTAGGGAIFNNVANPVISNCNFTANSGDYGGSIYNYSTSAPTITGCNFTTNAGGLFGGAIFSEAAASPVINNSRFTGNTSQFGGAIFNNGAATVTGCSFSGNQANSYGGAVYNNGASAASSYMNCVFVSNTIINAGGGGGGMFNNASLPVITNCTFHANNASFGGAIHNWATAMATVRNNIIWGNSSAIYNESAASATVQYSDVQGGYTGTGNLNVDPLFVNTVSPIGPDGVWGTVDDGLRLQACSPAVNAGNNALVPGSIINDATATPRIQYTTVDMGAYEANSITTAAAATLVSATTTAIAWQIPDGQTFYGINCTTLAAAVTGDGTATTISGITTVKVWIETIAPPGFVKRHYEITPQTNLATATGTVTLFFTQAEFDAFNALNSTKLPQGPADAAGKANLLIEKRSGTSTDNSGLPESYTGVIQTINPDDGNIIWNAGTMRWEVSFAVTGFSGFFVKTQSATLPLKLLRFTAEANDCMTTLQWTTANEINVSHFEVQQSTDGFAYSTVQTIFAMNTSHENNYSATVPVIARLQYYRLKMVDKDGETTYGKVVVVIPGCGTKIQVYPNPVADKLFIRNAAGSQYTIYDNAGRSRRVGYISNAAQEINVTSLTQGIYYIRVTSDGNNTSLKFLKK